MLVKAEAVRAQSQKVVEQLARWSYVAKAIFFGGVALLAARLVWADGAGPDPSRKQVLETLLAQPAGQLLVGLMVLALLGHTIWRLFETFLDPYDKGRSPGGLLHRFSYLLSGVSYGSIALTGAQLLAGAGTGEANRRQLWVASLLEHRAGPGLVGLAGLILLSWAGVQAKKALTKNLYDSLETDHLSGFWRGAIRLSGGIGFLAQAAVLAGSGFYLLRAAWSRDAGWVKTIAELFELLESLPHGAVWALLLAGGLAFFSGFMLVMARYFPLKLAKE